MRSETSPVRDAGPTRRSLLRKLTVLGAASALAGCASSGSSSTPSPDGSSGSSSTPAETTAAAATTTAGGSESFDCGAIPSSLTAFESPDVEFSFACDALPQPEYALETAEDAVERIATLYFARDGDGSSNNWDFYVELSESVGTYGDASNVFPKATEAFQLDYGGEEVPVRHQAITDDQDVWVMGLPEGGEFRVVQVSSAVMPGRFGCHDAVRAIARDVVRSIRPR